jgi:UDP-glucose:(heptosyl)LPS alpha-1,3-glucosyltransferase
MRIALVSESFDAFRGGAERSAVEILSALEARGHFVTRLARDPRRGRLSGQRALERAAVAARSDHDVSVSLTRAPADVSIPQGGVYLAGIRRALDRYGRAGRLFGALAKALSRRQQSFVWAERRAFRAAARVVAISRLVRSDLIAFGVDPARIELVPHGVDAARFAPPAAAERAAARARLGLLEGDLAALFVSHNFALRGLETLVRAMGLLGAPWRLVVAGRGRARPFERLARRLGARVTFFGPVGDPRPLYAAADVLAHPTFYDPSSRVTLEALASGLPVVTTRRNGAAELFSGAESAVIDDPRDARALAEALARFSGRAAREAAGRAARETALENPLAAELDRLAAIIEATAARKNVV